jgi:hypothetical protein
VSAARGMRGVGVVEYVGLVGAVCLLMLGLATLRPHAVDRRAPVRALPPLVRLLGEPTRLLLPAPPPGPTKPRRRPARPRRPAPARGPLILDLPDWVTR